MITQEVQQKNLNLFFDKLKQVGVNTELIERNLSDSLLNAPFTNINENGMDYQYENFIFHQIPRKN